MPGNVLVLGASRGLGASLLHKYAARGFHAIGTARGADPPSSSQDNISYVGGIDIATPQAGPTLAKAVADQLPSSGSDGSKKLDVAIINAGYFATESFDEPNWDAEVKMYTISAIGPVFAVQALVKAGLLTQGAKVMLITSEAGSFTLRDPEEEGFGNYAHHASKAAENMVGRVLSFDLKERGVAVGMIHPGFMRTEMTKGVGLDKIWDKAGAITPDEAADRLIDFIDTFDLSRTGEFWASNGLGDLVTGEKILGKAKDPKAPAKLPW